MGVYKTVVLIGVIAVFAVLFTYLMIGIFAPGYLGGYRAQVLARNGTYQNVTVVSNNSSGRT